MSTQKTLTILRHAKAATATAGQQDRDRKLADRGVDQSRALGGYFAAQHLHWDLVLSSTSVRTRETWAEITTVYKEKPPVEYTEKLYLTSAGEMVNLLSEIPEPVSNLLIIGHNPGLHELCAKLVKEGDDQLIAQLAAGFPTGALATITFSGEWKHLRSAIGTLAGYVTPEMIG